MSYKTDSKWLLDIKYKGHENEVYKSDLKRLKDGEPLDYIVGYSDFLNTKILLTSKPLIPRPETEYWVDKAISEIDKKSPTDILDIFSGSGCIGVALLKHIPKSTVTFAERRDDLLETIKKNVSINGLVGREFEIIQSDVFKEVSGKYDYIFANPPYIDREKKITDSSVIKFEPHDALFAKDSGLKYIKQLIKESRDYLKNNGALYIEFDSWQKDAINSHLERINHPYREIEFISDQYSSPRVVKLTI